MRLQQRGSAYLFPVCVLLGGQCSLSIRIVIKKYPGALYAAPAAHASGSFLWPAAVEASRSVAGAFCGAPAAPETDSQSVAGAFHSESWQQQKQRPGALQEFPWSAAIETTAGSVAGAFCGTSSRNSVWERRSNSPEQCRSVLWLHRWTKSEGSQLLNGFDVLWVIIL